MTKLHLASSSPRRVEILTALGLPFTAEGVDIDETPIPGEQARDMVLRLAEAKAQRAAASRQGLILGSDTVVVLDDCIFGKPGSMEDALDMLSRLSGRCHEVVTAIVLITGDEIFRDLSVTKVCFREIKADEAYRYWLSGEPGGKAGAYAIQGCGGVFVKSIAGSYSGVVGLPVYETAALLQRAGMPVLAVEFKQEAKVV